MKKISKNSKASSNIISNELRASIVGPVKIASSNDRSEQEANKVADKVMKLTVIQEGNY